MIIGHGSFVRKHGLLSILSYCNLGIQQCLGLATSATSQQEVPDRDSCSHQEFWACVASSVEINYRRKVELRDQFES
jgi:hypothetical protein